MEDNWLKDPWELHSIDGWLYGRGTTDNKGAARSCGVEQGALGQPGVGSMEAQPTLTSTKLGAFWLSTQPF